MANTLFDHGTGYHFHDANFTETYATMRRTEHNRTKLSKLEMLQEDFRSRLLHEREQKANALFEQKVKADLLPKGSVREFFLNRRMMAANNAGASSGKKLPPIKTNTRYNSKQKNCSKDVEKHLVDKRREKEAVAFLEDVETQDCNLNELDKLRQKYRKSKREGKHIDVSASNTAENRESKSEFSSNRDSKIVDEQIENTSFLKARRLKSREVHKRRKKQTHEASKERNTNKNSEELELSFNKTKMTKAARGVKSREVYKRGRPPPEDETGRNTNPKGELLASSESELVSKSLVKIKEVVNRRKTEELLRRSRTANLTAESLVTPSPRRQSQSFDEMSKAEMELRETISREQKKLLALQERRREKFAEFRNESRKEITKKESIQRHENTNLDKKREKKATTNASRYERHHEIHTEQTRLNPNTKRTGKSSGNETTDKIDTLTNSVSKKKNGNQIQQGKTRTTKSSDVESSLNSDLVTCSNCGRSFMKERITRHQNACKKASARVKKPFDAKRKRAEGTDMEKYIIMGKDTNDDPDYKVKKRDWRRTHQNFIQAIRSARQQEPQPAKPLTNPDYIECSYCHRKFKPTVAERHIPRCKDIKARPRPPRR